MNKYPIGLGAVMVITAALLGSTARAEGVFSDLGLNAEMTMEVYSKYVWRGFTLDTDPVIQSGVSVSGGGVTLSYWGNSDLDNDDALISAETNIGIEYARQFDSIGFSLGHTYYDLPGVSTHSKEWYVGFALPEFILSPSLTLYFDYGKEASGGGDGQYYLFSVGHTLSLWEDPAIALDVGVAVGFNKELFIDGDGGDITLTAGFTIPLTADLNFSPKLGYALPFGDMKDSADGDQQKRFYGGLSLTASF